MVSIKIYLLLIVYQGNTITPQLKHGFYPHPEQTSQVIFLLMHELNENSNLEKNSYVCYTILTLAQSLLLVTQNRITSLKCIPMKDSL